MNRAPVKVGEASTVTGRVRGIRLNDVTADVWIEVDLDEYVATRARDENRPTLIPRANRPTLRLEDA